MFKDTNLGNQVVKAATFIFRDPPLDGTRMVRSTLAAILLEDGRLFIGCSTCSESDQFTKVVGREKALAIALAKASKGVGGSTIMPDAIIRSSVLEDKFGDTSAINNWVKVECLWYQLEEYRRILYARHVLLEAANEMLAHDKGVVV